MTTVKRSDNPNDLYVHHLTAELRKVSAQYSIDARMKACKELAQIFYHGGVLESYLVEDSRSIEMVLGIIQNQKEPVCLRIQALQTLSSLCILADEVNRVLHNKHAMQLMIRQFRDGNDMIVSLLLLSFLFSLNDSLGGLKMSEKMVGPLRILARAEEPPETRQLVARTAGQRFGHGDIDGGLDQVPVQ
ncbi:hypothetical protein HDU81_010315 [Chytriomyces hyalinus]|nr:hypothetical protein HDU81_010315 [Chytriomyces hyalinus]